MKSRPATSNDLSAIQSLLMSQRLPYEDCASHLPHFFVIEVDNKIIATGGLEIYFRQALLRSLAVAPAFQGRGFGNALYLDLKNYASDLGVEQLFVLTETAVPYFAKRRFVQVKRSDTPESIQKTKQFSGLCPATAVVMCLDISG
jgi:amino-acid N-acetyltransferase